MWFTRKLSFTTQRNCFIWYNEFKNAVVVMGKHPKMVFRAFIESGVSLLFIYATVPAYFTGLNIDFDLQHGAAEFNTLFFAYSRWQRCSGGRLLGAVFQYPA